jgi:hypothetical protein
VFKSISPYFRLIIYGNIIAWVGLVYLGVIFWNRTELGEDIKRNAKLIESSSSENSAFEQAKTLHDSTFLYFRKGEYEIAENKLSECAAWFLASVRYDSVVSGEKKIADLLIFAGNEIHSGIIEWYKIRHTELTDSTADSLVRDLEEVSNTQEKYQWLRNVCRTVKEQNFFISKKTNLSARIDELVSSLGEEILEGNGVEVEVEIPDDGKECKEKISEKLAEARRLAKIAVCSQSGDTDCVKQLVSYLNREELDSAWRPYLEDALRKSVDQLLVNAQDSAAQGKFVEAIHLFDFISTLLPDNDLKTEAVGLERSKCIDSLGVIAVNDAIERNQKEIIDEFLALWGDPTPFSVSLGKIRFWEKGSTDPEQLADSLIGMSVSDLEKENRYPLYRYQASISLPLVDSLSQDSQTLERARDLVNGLARRKEKIGEFRWEAYYLFIVLHADTSEENTIKSMGEFSAELKGPCTDGNFDQARCDSVDRVMESRKKELMKIARNSYEQREYRRAIELASIAGEEGDSLVKEAADSLFSEYEMARTREDSIIIATDLYETYSLIEEYVDLPTRFEIAIDVLNCLISMGESNGSATQWLQRARRYDGDENVKKWRISLLEARLRMRDHQWIQARQILGILHENPLPDVMAQEVTYWLGYCGIEDDDKKIAFGFLDDLASKPGKWGDKAFSLMRTHFLNFLFKLDFRPGLSSSDTVQVRLKMRGSHQDSISESREITRVSGDTLWFKGIPRGDFTDFEAQVEAEGRYQIGGTRITEDDSFKRIPIQIFSQNQITIRLLYPDNAQVRLSRSNHPLNESEIERGRGFVTYEAGGTVTKADISDSLSKYVPITVSIIDNEIIGKSSDNSIDIIMVPKTEEREIRHAFEVAWGLAETNRNETAQELQGKSDYNSSYRYYEPLNLVSGLLFSGYDRDWKNVEKLHEQGGNLEESIEMLKRVEAGTEYLPAAQGLLSLIHVNLASRKNGDDRQAHCDSARMYADMALKGKNRLFASGIMAGKTLTSDFFDQYYYGYVLFAGYKALLLKLEAALEDQGLTDRTKVEAARIQGFTNEIIKLIGEIKKWDINKDYTVNIPILVVTPDGEVATDFTKGMANIRERFRKEYGIDFLK